jgi:sporadic carbohydrate cluster protein (TIGR04323 family)
VSFDFRIAANDLSLGTKPLANYRRRNELDGDRQPAAETSAQAEVSQELRTALMYSGICRSVTAKAQLVFLNAYAALNDIEIAGSESEIVTMSHAPVLRHYLRNATSQFTTVLAFSVDLLPAHPEERREILELAANNEIELIFAAEDINVRTIDDLAAVEALISTS